MVSRISTNTLLKWASIGGFATVGMGFAYEAKVSENIKNIPYCKEALRHLRAHPGAVHLLGEPIKAGKIKMGTGAVNFTKETTSQYQIPVKGPKEKGIMYLWASRPDQKSEWTLESVELGLKSDLKKRLIIKRSPNNIT